MTDCRCSFVIPVLDEAPALAALLPALRRAFPRAELLVVDGGSRDASVATAMPLCNQLLLSPPGRATQMNLGARAASGDYLLFLHADTLPLFGQSQLDEWCRSRPRWGFCPLRLSGRGAALRLVERGINLRARLTGVATGDQMLSAERAWFLAQGAFAEIPLMEDVELSKRLRALTPPLVLPGHVRTSSRRWEERGVLFTVLQMWTLRLAYRCGVSPRRLWHYYYGR